MLELRDDVLDIAVTPDRGYCLSIRGLAREAAQATGRRVHRSGRPARCRWRSPTGTRSSSSPAACPIFVALTVTGIDPSRPSPRWLARRVQLAGMRSISLAVDITNYVMLETGPADPRLRPRPAGRPDRGAPGAADGEKLTTLDDVVRPLDAEDLLITDDSGPIGLAGVMGGASTELSARTTDVVIEAAHFDAMTIARTSRRHKLSSEASRRFERGVDPAAGVRRRAPGRPAAGRAGRRHAAATTRPYAARCWPQPQHRRSPTTCRARCWAPRSTTTRVVALIDRGRGAA